MHYFGYACSACVIVPLFVLLLPVLIFGSVAFKLIDKLPSSGNFQAGFRKAMADIGIYLTNITGGRYGND